MGFHKDEIQINDKIVERLLADQFPELSTQPVRRIDSSGTVHAIFRIGDNLAMRLPLLPVYERDVVSDWHWLRFFASLLPLQIPVPTAIGDPTEYYPCRWLIVRWITGVNATASTLLSMGDTAASLGDFVLRLRSIDIENTWIDQYRGRPLRLRDARTREAIAAVADEYDARDLSNAWSAAIQIPDWTEDPCFFHGDLHSGNLISEDGVLTAAIDFGGLGTGDPSVDGIPGWWLFDADTRGIFRDAGRFTDEMWMRARGWALSIALIALPYYRTSNPVFADMARHAINEVLADGT